MRVFVLSRRARFVAALALYAVLAAGAGVRPGGAQSKYYDIRGDFSSLKTINGENVLELRQNVRIVHGDVTANADHAISYTLRRVTQMTGHVKVVQGTMTMTGEEGEYRQLEDLAVLKRRVHIVDEGWTVDCDEVRYSRLADQAWLIGNVVARDSSATVHADRILYQRRLERAEAFGNVQLISESDRVVVKGDHGVYWRGRSEGLIDKNPTLISGPDDPEPVTVVSDTMRVYPDSARATAYYRVKIIKGNTVTQCDSAMLWDDRKYIELFGNPLAKQDNVSMKGDKMVAHYTADEINRIDIQGKARIDEAQRDSLVVGRNSWVEGDTIHLYIHDNNLDSLYVFGNAASEYYPRTPRKVEANGISGNRMFFRFAGDDVDFVDVRGTAKGTYRYLDLESTETADSLRVAADTALTYVPFETRAEDVTYSAERIQYHAASKDLILEDNARLTYKGSELTGQTIRYHSSLQILDATGSPTLSDDGQKILGERMDYDMESETGLVTQGSTQYEQGYYSGERLAKVGANEMKVWNSWYTTCDLKNPHYHFAAKNMKVYPDDKVFTGPIWLHIGETPIMALPFLANSISRGRRSGILRPDFEFGINQDSQRFISGLGYYWATNDYMDFKFVADFYEDDEWRLHVNNRYALRYNFNGHVSYNLVKGIEDQRSEWTLENGHYQTLGERATLTADLRFVSSDDAPSSVNTIDDVDRYIDRSIRSTASLRKSWDNASFSGSVSRTQNLDIVDPNAVKVQATMPDVTVSIPQFKVGGSTDAGAGLWSNLLAGLRVNPTINVRRNTVEKLFEYSEDVTSATGLGFSSTQRLGFLSVSPRIGANVSFRDYSLQRDAHFEYETNNSIVDTTFVSALDSSLTETNFRWDTGIGASTNFYGTFYPRVGVLRGIRHTLSPVATYSLTPAQDGSPRRQGVALSIRNALDLKVLDPPKTAADSAAADTSSTERLRKVSNVVGWTLSTNYNPDRPSATAWSDIQSNMNLQLFGARVSLNQVYDPHSFERRNTSLTSDFVIRGSHPFGKSERVNVEELNVVAASDTSRKDKEKDFTSGGVEFTQTGGAPADLPGSALQLEEGRLPWSLGLGVSYNKDARGLVRSTVRLNFGVELTENWTVDYSTIYDAEARELTGQHISVTRDLHCWQMSLSRQILGDEWIYYFRIALKAHPDLYGESGERGAGGGLIGGF